MSKNQNTWDQFASNLSDGRPQEPSPDNEADKIWKKTSLSDEPFNPETDRAWKSLMLKAAMREQQRGSNWWKIAASISLLAVVSWLLWQYQFQSYAPSEIIVFAPDTVKQVDLPDGSTVWLNQYAQLTYQSDFNSAREVLLTGEAFFEVTKSNGKTFTVLTENTKTVVLGTSFNVKEDHDGEVTVQVATGKVAFGERKKEQKNRVLLTPGKQASFKAIAKDPITPKPIDDINYRSWQNQKLTFNNINLPDIARKLSSHYETSISIAPELSSCRFTVSFDHQSLSEVLEILKLTGDLNISKENKGYQITGQSCN